MTWLQRLALRVRQFLGRFLEVRQAPPDMFERPAEPRLRTGIKTVRCPYCGRDFSIGSPALGFHQCSGRAA